MTAEDDTEVLHYAACNDCTLYKWVESRNEAEIAAEKHHFQRDHDSFWGEVPEHAIGHRKKHANAGEYADD